MKHANQTVKFFSGIRTAAALIFAIFVLASCAGTSKVVTQKPYAPPEAQGPSDQDRKIVAALFALSGSENLQNGDYDGAVSDFQKSAEIAPASDQPQYRELLGIAHGERGISLARKESYTSAISDLETSVRLTSATYEKRYSEAMGIVYGARGVSKGAEGYFDSAIRDLEKAVRLLPDGERKSMFREMLAAVYAGRGKINEMSGNKVGALTDYIKSLENVVMK